MKRNLRQLFEVGFYLVLEVTFLACITVLIVNRHDYAALHMHYRAWFVWLIVPLAFVGTTYKLWQCTVRLQFIGKIS